MDADADKNPSWVDELWLYSSQQSHHHAAHACCCSLMSCKLPLLRRKAPHAWVFCLLNLHSFSSAVSAARGAQQLIFFYHVGVLWQWEMCLLSKVYSVQLHQIASSVQFTGLRRPFWRHLKFISKYFFDFVQHSRLNWMERTWIAWMQIQTKKSRLQHVQEGHQWQRQSLWFIHMYRLHFLSQEVQRDPIQPSARSI